MAVTQTMDFFEHQDAARKKTGLLIGYYAIAVVLIILGVYAAFAATFAGASAKMAAPGETVTPALWNPALFVGVLIGTLAVVLFGSLYKVASLSGGGASVATLLGGRPVNPNTTDPGERRFLNVVEEMAIASGTSVPRVFVLDGEDGINAFAAGFSPANAVIAVTRGCLDELKRDELQGVIAHEFSHILNGDMRLNIRLMGVLHGILIIGLVGYWIFRTSLYSGSSRSRNSKGNSMPIVVLGLVVMALGFIGVFFGKLIKSAVSRQREFLADASAVQFTRNPAGIGGALRRIGGFDRGSRLKSTHAEEASHFFFSNGLSSSLASLMATHPPLKERIRRIDAAEAADIDDVGRGRTGAAAAGAAGFAGGTGASYAVEPDEVVARVGAPAQEHVDYAAVLLGSLPRVLMDAAHEPFGARAVVYALLLNRDDEPRAKQIHQLEEHADAAVCAETLRLAPHVGGLASEGRLPLLDVAVSSLKSLAAGQYETFRENVQQLVAADNQVDLFEYALHRMIQRSLDPVHRGTRAPSVRYRSLKPVLANGLTLLGALAAWGEVSEDEARRAFAAGASKLGVASASMPAGEAAGFQAVDNALGELARSAPAVKRQILDACVSCVGADGKVTVVEAELLRAVADSLGCPIPPFLPGQRLAA